MNIGYRVRLSGWISAEWRAVYAKNVPNDTLSSCTPPINAGPKNPQTKFVLLHCSSPWIYDTIALVRTFPNTYPDLSWLPQLTSSGACRMIHDLIEAGAADKTCWGCDTWTPEESLGSLYAFRHVLSKALAKKNEEGYLGSEEAKKVVQQIMCQ